MEKSVFQLRCHKINNSIQIFDLSGKLMWKFNSVKNNQKIELESIPKGIYFIKILSEDSTEYKKLIIK